MAPGLLLGLGAGLGVWMCIRALHPAARSLHDELDLLRRPQPLRPIAAMPPFRDRVIRIATALSFDRADRSLTADLAVLDRDYDQYAVEKLTTATAGLLTPALFAAVCAVGGVNVPSSMVAVACVGLAVAGYAMPRLLVRSEAARRRDDFRHGLSAYLDLVAILLAGGRGVESALWDAAGTGSSWPFRLLHGGLEQAARHGRSPWRALGELGDRLDLVDLSQLTSSIQLAGSSGAKVKASLIAKADSLRDHELAAAESAAERATEQMAVPVVLLLVAFLLFIGWPAVAHVLAL
jgi:Flp pilus assembly protein TadB